MQTIQTPTLTDPFGRQVTYLRISVTDRCDFRCAYCMAEDMDFLPREQVLTLEEIHFIARAFCELGVSKIRLTGGEPLVRKNILWLCESLGRLPGLRELVLTTNGSQLEKYAEALRAAGVKRINISFDSLDPAVFQRLTRSDRLSQVLRGIEAARAVGFERIKLNSVVLKGYNHTETTDLVRFAVEQGLDITFIEEMPLGLIDSHERMEVYYSSSEVRRDLERHFTLLPSVVDSGGPARYFQVASSDTRVGFISPHSHNFCDTCNRVRLTTEGQLLLCLGQEHSMDLKRIVRAHPGDRERLKQALFEAMTLKPLGHDFQLQGQTQILRYMNKTGG